MAEQVVEHEICGNCKKEIPQSNYVMHTAHCARNIRLCKVCKEPVPRANYENHAKDCLPSPKPKQKSPEPPKTNLEKSVYYQARKEVEDKKEQVRKEKYLERHEKYLGHPLGRKLGPEAQNVAKPPVNKIVESNVEETNKVTFSGKWDKGIYYSKPNGTGAVKKEEKKVNGATAKPSNGLMACRYCELELPRVELDEHENYCGSRTDKCLECGELVMFKHKQTHLDTNHSFLKLNDEPGPKPSWDSTTQKSVSPPRRRRFQPTIYTDFSQFDPTDYLPSNYQIPKPKIEKGESYKEISRRLDCPAPQPPSRRRNPPTELHIPCEFCNTPIPHRDLVQHETGCRPELFFTRSRNYDEDFFEARAPSPEEPRKPSRRRQPGTDLLIPCEFCDRPIPEDRLIEHQTGCRPDLARLEVPEAAAATPEVELPCEFCADMIPASQLYGHQASCR